MTTRTRYDRALFLELNEEYESKRVLANPPPVSEGAKRLERKQRTARNIDKELSRFVDIRGKTVLDFGCGLGDLDIVLAEQLGCTVTGVDVRERVEWKQLTHPQVQRMATDLSEEVNAARFAGTFDVIVSNSVLEHVLHPYRALQGLKTVLKPGGVAWIKANLYRGPLASHRYREVFFPWPHLLFTDEVFEQFYKHIGMHPKRAAWVNKLTHLHYRDYFDRIGFEVLSETFNKSSFDEEFYARFEEVLGRYPRSDLERDFINVVIRPRGELSSRKSRRSSERQPPAGSSASVRPASFRPLVLPRRSRALESRWTSRVDCSIARTEEGAIRCEVATANGTKKGQYGGIRLPTPTAGTLRLDLELISPDNIEAVYLDGEGSGHQRFLRWKWSCKRDQPAPQRSTFTFQPGNRAGPFRPADPVVPERVEEFHLFIRVRPSSRAGFIVHRADIAAGPDE